MPEAAHTDCIVIPDGGRVLRKGVDPGPMHFASPLIASYSTVAEVAECTWECCVDKHDSDPVVLQNAEVTCRIDG